MFLTTYALVMAAVFMGDWFLIFTILFTNVCVNLWHVSAKHFFGIPFDPFTRANCEVAEQYHLCKWARIIKVSSSRNAAFTRFDPFFLMANRGGLSFFRHSVFCEVDPCGLWNQSRRFTINITYHDCAFCAIP